METPPPTSSSQSRPLRALQHELRAHDAFTSDEHIMSGFGTPPAIPTQFEIYNSYEVDPQWQRKFTVIWASFTGAAIVVSLPYLVRSIRNRRAFTGLFGVTEDLNGRYEPVTSKEDTSVEETTRMRTVKRSFLWASLKTFSSVFLYSPPGLGMDLGQILVVAGYLATVIACLVTDAQLISNANRAGFLAIAQLPVVFLFATKNSVLSLLLGPGNGWEKLNYIHRWSGRGMFLCGLLHGVLWIRNHLQYGLPILGPQKETSGVACFALLCLIVLSSLRPVRAYFYQVFFILHVLLYPALFITICYHTIYAAPYIYPPLAFYGLDLLMRALRLRIKDATLSPAGSQMTLIHVHDADGGWLAGQHVRLRVFISGRFFESHPLTILSAPPRTSCLASPGLLLAARAAGDWSRALHAYADSAAPADGEKGAAGRDVQVMLDGPYGGCSLDLGEYESAFLVAGGAGATFTLGLLDDIVGRCARRGRARGERTRRVAFVWMVRSFGSMDWFAPQLAEIARAAAASGELDVRVRVFVTCLCDPDAVPDIPNCAVRVGRPSVRGLLDAFLFPSASPSPSPSLDASTSPDPSKVPELSTPELELECTVRAQGGGVAVCASGPASLTGETQNAVARLGTRAVPLGGIGVHTEVFAL